MHGATWVTNRIDIFQYEKNKRAHEPVCVYVCNRNTFLESFTFLILILYLAQPTDSLLHRCEAKWKTWKGAQKINSKRFRNYESFQYSLSGSIFKIIFAFFSSPSHNLWLFFLLHPSLTTIFFYFFGSLSTFTNKYIKCWLFHIIWIKIQNLCSEATLKTWWISVFILVLFKKNWWGEQKKIKIIYEKAWKEKQFQ